MTHRADSLCIGIGMILGEETCDDLADQSSMCRVLTTTQPPTHRVLHLRFCSHCEVMCGNWKEVD